MAMGVTASGYTECTTKCMCLFPKVEVLPCPFAEQFLVNCLLTEQLHGL